MRRYWPGKAPDWAEEREGGRSGSEEASDDEDEAVAAAAIAPPVIVRASEDPRLRRLAEVRACAADLLPLLPLDCSP